MSEETSEIAIIYGRYIDCLNRQNWAELNLFVHDDVCHNDRPLALSGFIAMLENDYREIPDLRFKVDLLITDPPRLASRLVFDCSPKDRFLGLEVNSRRILFTENVFYEFRENKIARVWSVIDKAAIEAQLKDAF